MPFSKLHIVISLIILTLISTNSVVKSLDFNFSSFPESNQKYLISENSNLAKNAIQVTNDLSDIADVINTSGRSLYYKPFRIWRRKSGTKNETIKASFESEFVLNISPDPRNQYPIGEGIAFVLSGEPSLPQGSEGDRLGIVAKNASKVVKEIVAVEFDTRKSFPEDLDDNHVGLNLNSVYSVSQVSLTGRGINISLGEDIRVRVSYNGENITVFVAEASILSRRIELSEHLPERVYVGFSASTGPGTFQRNCVKSWAFRGTNISPKPNLFRVFIAVPVTFFIVVVAVFLLFRTFRREGSDETYPSVEDAIRGSSTAPKKFALKELRRATDNFSPKNKLGQGGFGTVYKGVLVNGETVAVKRVAENSRQGKQEFVSEITTIAGLSHRNLVRLIGWCYESSELLIVYEFMPNGSLDRFLFDDKTITKSVGDEQNNKLTWETRKGIVLGVARALEYLHNGSENRVLHRDIKASNVMIDAGFEARLGDFGLARAVPRQADRSHHSTREIAGTPGYMAPESFFTGRATVETDVYAFGVLLLEVVSGKKPAGNNHSPNGPGFGGTNALVGWAWRLHSKGRASDAADPSLVSSEADTDEQFRVWAEEELGCVVELGLACCHPNPDERPSMKTILKVLEGEEGPPTVPEEVPSFVWPSFKTDGGDTTTQCGQLTPFTDFTGR